VSKVLALSFTLCAASAAWGCSSIGDERETVISTSAASLNDVAHFSIDKTSRPNVFHAAFLPSSPMSYEQKLERLTALAKVHCGDSERVFGDVISITAVEPGSADSQSRSLPSGHIRADFSCGALHAE